MGGGIGYVASQTFYGQKQAGLSFSGTVNQTDNSGIAIAKIGQNRSGSYGKQGHKNFTGNHP